MKRKKWIIIAIFMVMVLGTAARTYATAKQITAKDLGSLDDPATKAKVSEILLKDIGKSEVIDPSEVQSITATYGKTMNSDDDVVIVSKYGPELTIVAVYKKDDGAFDFLGEIGIFFDVKDVNCVELKNLKQDAVFLKEYAQQDIGAFESTTFLRGYLWNDNGFKLIYSAPEKIIADWNKCIDSGKEGEQAQWNRIKQTSKTKLENGNYPVIKAQRWQSYLKSNDIKAKNMPEDSTFSEVLKRNFCESYYWSDQWGRFILSQKIDKTTGEKVAVLEEWVNLCYTMSPDFQAYKSKVRIARNNGETEIVEREILRDVTENKKTIDET